MQLATHAPSVTTGKVDRSVCSQLKLIHAAFRLLMTCAMLFACQSNPASKQNIANTTPAPKEIRVPGWYAEMPQIPGCRLAHAHSGVFIDADRQEEALLKNGAANLAKSSRVALEVGWAGSQKSHYSRTASYIKEENWQSRAKALEEELEIIKQYRLDQSMLALVGICSGQMDPQSLSAALNDTLVNLSSEKPPTWVSDPLQADGRFFGVGTASGYTTAAKAWQEAERQARADIALRLAAQYKVLERNLSQNNYADAQLISETHAKLTLRNLEVIRHAYSHAGRTFYALVSMPAVTTR